MKFVSFKWLEKKYKPNKDMIYKYRSKWPIYSLSLKTKTGTWSSFEEKIKILSDHNLVQDITDDEINLFLDKNQNIEFEMIVFQKLLSEVYFLKINNNIYSYTTNIPKKNRIDVRFYFDIDNFLSSDLFC